MKIQRKRNKFDAQMKANSLMMMMMTLFGLMGSVVLQLPPHLLRHRALHIESFGALNNQKLFLQRSRFSNSPVCARVCSSTWSHHFRTHKVRQ